VNISQRIYRDASPLYEENFVYAAKFQVSIYGGQPLVSNTFFSALDKNHLGIANMVGRGYCTDEIRVNYINQVLGNYFTVPALGSNYYGNIVPLEQGGFVDYFAEIPADARITNYVRGDVLYLALQGYDPSMSAPILVIDYAVLPYENENDLYFVLNF
jgi:hypothetical protein